ncbi:MAG: polysaccharide deacetylase family protein [Chloroflexi bacterium]|nr:polysaccharide deacetylase family protein [Chloroflexota bacterium]
MISVVIPALNEGNFLADCLKSLTEQDYEGEYELIVADNGSTDNTVAIAEGYGAKVVSCPEKRSVFYARQIGADAACGDIIVQADADTIYPANWIRRIAEQFACHEQAVAITGRYVYRDPPRWAKLEYFLRHAVNRLTCALFGRPLSISGATLAFCRKAFVEANGYHGITWAADQYGIAERLSKAGKILYDSGALAVTSARTVNRKPFIVILGDLIVHIGKWVRHLSDRCAGALEEFSGKTRARRIAFKLMPAATALVVFVVYGYFIPTSPVFGKVYFGADTNQKVIALTFDDGPNDPYTSQILDVLGRYDVKATFFLIGRNVELYPETARRMLQEGHVLGNHSYSHNANHALTQSGAKDMALAQQAILAVTGVLPYLYRPPHGKKTPWELGAVKKNGMIEVNWNVATAELTGRPATWIAQQIVRKTTPGDIILLHDGYGIDHDIPRANKSVTVEALPIIIEQLHAKGYMFVTVPDLLGTPAYERQSNEPGISPPASPELYWNFQP